MTVQQVSVGTHSRAKGHSAVAGAAYRSGSELTDERTGEVHEYLAKGANGVEHSEIVLPAHAPDWAHDRSRLWNAAEAAEKRADATVAREFLICFPDELSGPGSTEARAEMAREYTRALVEKHGFAAEFSMHKPGEQGDDRNWHCHVLTSTRRMEENGFTHPSETYKSGPNKGLPKASEKCRELDAGGKNPAIAAVEAKELWSQITSRELERAGFNVEAKRWEHAHLTKERQAENAFQRGDFDYYKELSGKAPGVHRGPSATALERRGIESEAGNVNREISKEALKKEAERLEWAERIKNDPSALLDKMLERKAVFTQGDLEREAAKHIGNGTEMAGVVHAAMNDPRLVRVAEAVPATATTRAVREKFSPIDFIALERNMVARAEVMSGRQTHRVDAATVDKVLAKTQARLKKDNKSLTEEQVSFIRSATDGRQFFAGVGDAGTGKSFSAGIAREIWEANGYTVKGIALAGKAAKELRHGADIKSRTIESFIRRLDRGAEKIDAKTVIVLDEAGMVGSRQFAELEKRVEAAGAKLVAVGDHKQLAAINAGSPFRVIVETVGASELTNVRRQKDQWQKDASYQIARGDYAKGIEAYRERGNVHMSETRADARTALIDQYMRDLDKPNRDGKPATQAIITHTTKDVEALNNEVRERLKERGQLQDGKMFETSYGQREFASGDRLLFRQNDSRLGEPEAKRGRPPKSSKLDKLDKELHAKVDPLVDKVLGRKEKETGVDNGSLGTVESVSENRMTVKLDDGRKVTFDPAKYQTFDHGNAFTAHKLQGASVDRAYALATPGMGKELSYVVATRQTEDFNWYAGKEDFRSPDRERRAAEALLDVEAKKVELANSKAYLAEAQGKLEQIKSAGVEQTPAKASAQEVKGDTKGPQIEATGEREKGTRSPVQEAQFDVKEAQKQVDRNQVQLDKAQAWADKAVAKADAYNQMVERTGKADKKESTLDYVPRDRDLSAQMEAYEKAKAAKTLSPETVKALESATPASRFERDMAWSEQREATTAQRKSEARDPHAQARMDAKYGEQRAEQTKEPKQSTLDAKQQAKEPAHQKPKDALDKLLAERQVKGTEKQQSALERALDAKQQAKEPAQQQKKGIEM